MLLAYGAARGWLSRRGRNWIPYERLATLLFGSPWSPLVFAFPTTALPWVRRQRVGIDAALDRHNSFLIGPVKLLYHASFFIADLGLYRVRHRLERLARRASWYLALSVPVFLGRAWLLGRDWVTPLVGVESWALSALGALFSWLMVFGTHGAALGLFRRSSPVLSYLADSSY